jgi:hypothetical protein
VSGVEMESALRAIPPSTTLSNNRRLDYVWFFNAKGFMKSRREKWNGTLKINPDSVMLWHPAQMEYDFS